MSHVISGGRQPRRPASRRGSGRPDERGENAWPAQLRLPGQAAAPDGPVDMSRMYVAHFGFRRDLAAFAAAASATPVEDRRTWAALAHRWDLFATILRHHHGGEDARLWPLLMERGDDSDRAVLEAMKAEHAEIEPILASCEAGLARLARPHARDRADEDTRNALVVRLCAGRESLGRHLAREETEAIDIIQRVLTHADWERLEREHFAPEQISLGLLLNGLAWIGHRLPRAARDRLLAEWPPLNRLIWRITSGPFARRERRTFRYAD